VNVSSISLKSLIVDYKITIRLRYQEEHSSWVWFRKTKHFFSSRLQLPHGLGKKNLQLISA